MLRERIVFTLGLFCGHMKSARFVESLAWQMAHGLGDLLELARTYGCTRVVEAIHRGEGFDAAQSLTGGIEDLDDYFRCRIERAEDIRELFVPRFYFGCEGAHEQRPCSPEPNVSARETIRD